MPKGANCNGAKSRDRLLQAAVAEEFLTLVIEQARLGNLLRLCLRQFTVINRRFLVANRVNYRD